MIDIEKRRRRKRRWYYQNIDKSRARVRQYQQTHKEKRRQYYKRWYQVNKITQRQKTREYAAKRRRDPMYKYQKRRLDYLAHIKRRVRLMTILGGIVCRICGNNDYRCLDFEHRDDDGSPDRHKFTSTYKWLTYYLQHPKEAMKKLQVLCSNCNRIKRYEKSRCILDNQKKLLKKDL